MALAYLLRLNPSTSAVERIAVDFWAGGGTGGVDVNVEIARMLLGAAGVDEGFVGKSNPLPVAACCSTGTTTTVNASAGSVTVLAANAARLGFGIKNESTEKMYVKYGATASLTSYLYDVYPGAIFEDPWGYRGRVDAIWGAAVGAARVLELTP